DKPAEPAKVRKHKDDFKDTHQTQQEKANSPKATAKSIKKGTTASRKYAKASSAGRFPLWVLATIGGALVVATVVGLYFSVQRAGTRDNPGKVSQNTDGAS